MTIRTLQVYFPTSLRLGPADRFLAALGVCRGLFGNRLAAGLNWLRIRVFGEIHLPGYLPDTLCQTASNFSRSKYR